MITSEQTLERVSEIEQDMLHGRHDCVLQKLRTLGSALINNVALASGEYDANAAAPKDRAAMEDATWEAITAEDLENATMHLFTAAKPEMVNHPAHYGGEDNPYEVIKIIEHYNLGFALGNSVKYILRCEFKGTPLEDLKKAQWYLNREITNREREANNAASEARDVSDLGELLASHKAYQAGPVKLS